MRPLNLGSAVLLLLAAAACTDNRTPTTPTPPEPPKEAPHPIGVYTIEVTGIGTDQMRSTVVAAPSGPDGIRPSMTNAGNGLVIENVSATAFNEGSRSNGGERYISFLYRIKNGTGVSLNNVTLMLVGKSNTIAGTPISSLKRLDGANADPAIAPQIVPTGPVALGGDAVTVQALYPDVLQVLSEAEVAAITPPAGVTNIFPVGYMVRSKLTNANRTLPVPTDPNEYDGLMTIAFRLPLQPTSAQDVSSIFFEILAVTDSENRLTETIEESQDTAAVRRLRDRAVALGATTVTVLNGSPAMDPAVPDYPGQRQICSPRTAGTAGSPTTTMVSPAAYSTLMLLNPGESVDACAAYFRTGTSSRPATNVPYLVTVDAMDRYGNVKTATVDTVHLDQVSGPPYSTGAASALVSGSTSIYVSYSDYGTSVMGAVGRRLAGNRTIPVAGVTRTWTASAGTTDWNTALNWYPNAVPMTLDSVYVPVAAPLDPVLASNVQVLGVTVEDVATLNLGAFNLTAGNGSSSGANVSAGLNGGITNTSGTLILAGIGSTIQGKVPRLRVTGTYSLTGTVIARAPIQSDAGRITASAFRLQADSN
jgi:hypothetical protein